MADFGGDANIQQPAALIGDTTRAKLLLALMDGRALPMSTLAAETGLAQSTVSGHLGKLLDGGLLTVQRQGRHRYYSLASAEVANAVEALARIAPTLPVRSLRADTRARALRLARTCYDHLAGRLGVEVMRALVDQGALIGGDGTHHPECAVRDRLSAPGGDVEYRVTDRGWTALARVGIRPVLTRRPLVRYCVDWTEQRHHLAGALGAAMLQQLVGIGWLSRPSQGRALRVEPAGYEGFQQWLDIDARKIDERAA